MARSVSDSTKIDTLSIKTRVPGMEPIVSGADNIIIYTSTEQYHRLENSNHGTLATLTAIDSAVHGYAREYGMPADIFLAVIDMSLPLGGGFDLHGGWNQDIQRGGAGHEYHRLGKSADFSYFYRNANGQVITVNIYIDDELRQTTNRIDDVELDQRFDRVGFDRWERRIRKIHYESRN